MRAVVSAAPRYAALAAAELATVLPPGLGSEELAPGVWLLHGPGAFADLARALEATTFVRHACPAEVDVEAGDDPLNWAAQVLLPAIAQRPGLAASLARAPELQVQTRVLPGGPPWRPGPLAAAVREALGRPTQGAAAGHVLSVVIGPGRGLAGLCPRSQLLSPWPGGEARLRAAPDELSRAARKLEEACQLFGVEIAPGSLALDLGAAPGGWTQYLLDRGSRVVAVDTAALAPALQGRPGLTFLQGPAARVRLPRGPFDLLVADLSWDPLAAAALALRAAPRLAPGAPGILTVKFFGSDPLATIAAVRARLEAGGLKVRAVRHLYHNRAEATALVRA